jgi:hypothetical protein
MPRAPAIQLRVLAAIFLRVTPRVPVVSKAASSQCDMRVPGQFPWRLRRDISCSLHADVTTHRAMRRQIWKRLKDGLEQPVYRSAWGRPRRIGGAEAILYFLLRRCTSDTWLQNKIGEIRETFDRLAQYFHLAERADFRPLQPATWRRPARRPTLRRCRQTCARARLSSASYPSRIARRHSAQWGRLRP